MTLKKTFVALGCLMVVGGFCLAQPAKRPLVMPHSIVVESTDAVMTPTKVEAGLVLALGASQQFRYMPIAVRDSLVRSRAELAGNKSARVAEALGAEKIVFISAKRFENLIQAQLSFASGSGYQQMVHGVGYAAIRYKQNEIPVPDPAILLAFQRALMQVLGNDSVFGDLDSGLRAVPAEVFAPGSFRFETDLADKETWKIFTGQVVMSFDAVQTIVHALQDRADVVVVDVETRDSMFAKGGLHVVENNQAQSNSELRILKLFAVDNVINGVLRRTNETVSVELSLSALQKDGSIQLRKKASAVVAEDSVESFRGAIIEALASLIPTER